MYGGLFGDLPATKKNDGNTTTSSSSTTATLQEPQKVNTK
jgi:hypothetical protein